VATIFLFVLLSNYSGLIPGVGSIGIYHEEAHSAEVQSEGEVDAVVVEEEAEVGEGEVVVVEEAGLEAEEEHHAILVPLFRAPSADLNVTLALALVTMVMVQFWGVQALGANYFHKFFNFNTGKGFIRGIFAFSGILELISEFAKIISFAFRLFGNIFAGEVLLAVMAFLVAFIVPVAFYGLELFVGFIQALVFMMLAVVFFSTAVISHGDHGDDHH
jgi:F-type H+-transporting ATPase subunit a